MPKRQDAIFRAWKEPLMGHAAGLVSEGEEGAEYKIAAQLGWDGGLFASFTSKEKAQLAEGFPGDGAFPSQTPLCFRRASAAARRCRAGAASPSALLRGVVDSMPDLNDDLDRCLSGMSGKAAQVLAHMRSCCT